MDPPRKLFRLGIDALLEEEICGKLRWWDGVLPWFYYGLSVQSVDLTRTNWDLIRRNRRRWGSPDLWSLEREKKRSKTLKPSNVENLWKPYVQTQKRYEEILQDSTDDAFLLSHHFHIPSCSIHWCLQSRQWTDPCGASVLTLAVHQISEILCNMSNVTNIYFGHIWNHWKYLEIFGHTIWNLKCHDPLFGTPTGHYGPTALEPAATEVAMKLHGWTSKRMCRRWRTRQDDC